MWVQNPHFENLITGGETFRLLQMYITVLQTFAKTVRSSLVTWNVGAKPTFRKSHYWRGDLSLVRRVGMQKYSYSLLSFLSIRYCYMWNDLVTIIFFAGHRWTTKQKIGRLMSNFGWGCSSNHIFHIILTLRSIYDNSTLFRPEESYKEFMDAFELKVAEKFKPNKFPTCDCDEMSRLWESHPASNPGW